MTIVYIPGTWDLLHPGHVLALKRAKLYGDTLIVGVESDELIAQSTGHPPILDEHERSFMLESLGCVDAAIVYRHHDYKKTLERLAVDVLVMSETNTEERHLEVQKRWGGVLLPYTGEISTTEIKRRIVANER